MNQEENQPTAETRSASINEQVTDAVTQSNVKVVAEAPAIALGNVYQTAAHATGIMFENAVNAQQQQNILGQAATNQGVTQVYNIDTGADAIAVAKILKP
jgi:hypothetical protein